MIKADDDDVIKADNDDVIKADDDDDVIKTDDDDGRRHQQSAFPFGLPSPTETKQ